MRKIDSLFNHNSQLQALAQKVMSHQLLQQCWVAASPEILSNLSTAGNLSNGLLTIYAHSAIAANKIKLSQASLLTQLHHLQQTNPRFRECKVTAIVVKVQVKSLPKAPTNVPRKLSQSAANNLKKLALDLGESPLSAQLNSLANKT